MAFQSEEQRKAVMAILASGERSNIRRRSKRWGRMGGAIGGAVGGIAGGAKYGTGGAIFGGLSGAIGGYLAGRMQGSAYERLGVKYQKRKGRRRGKGMKAVHAAGSLIAPPPVSWLYSKVRGPRGRVLGATRAEKKKYRQQLTSDIAGGLAAVDWNVKARG